MTSGRRPLRFDRFDEVMPDVERLLRGHVTVGNWSLARICHHLAAVLRRHVDLPASTTFDPALRASDEAKRRVFDTGLIPEGVEAPPGVVAESVGPAAEEAEALRAAIAYYLASPGPAIPHRLFGPLTKDEWDRFELIHLAHHLSFALPTAD
ncbi:MAG: DUF1569 domain-containing protein [Thermoleophilia bacterium]|nr:DUF1569 domain-containing protein [Thermoleophilia bacterium]